MGSSAFTVEPPSTEDAGQFTVEPPAAPAKRDWLDEAADFASGLWSKVNPKTQVVGAATLAAHPISTYVTDSSQRQELLDQAEKDFKNGDYGKGVARSLYGIIPFLGPQMAEAGTDIGTGHAAKGLGESTGLGLMLSSPEIFKGLKKGTGSVSDSISAARQAAADALTTQKGTLTPSTRAAGQLGGAVTGAVTGGAMGHPIIGAIEGWRSGPSLVRALLGERTPMAPEDLFNQRVQKLVENAKVREAARQALEPSSTPNAPTSPKFDTDGVIHVPEPNEPALGEKPGSMYSVPREQLIDAAMRKKAGASDVLRDLGKPMIIIPRGADLTQ